MDLGNGTNKPIGTSAGGGVGRHEPHQPVGQKNLDRFLQLLVRACFPKLMNDRVKDVALFRVHPSAGFAGEVRPEGFERHVVRV